MTTSAQTRLKFKSLNCVTALEKVRKQKDDDVISKKRKLVDEESTLMKGKKEEVIKCINAMNKGAEKMYIETEEKPIFYLLTKGNSFRKQSWINRKF